MNDSRVRVSRPRSKKKGQSMQLSDFHWSDIITKLVAAIVILVVTAIISKLVKKFLTAQLSKIKIFQRQAGSGDNLAASLGQIVSLLVLCSASWPS